MKQAPNAVNSRSVSDFADSDTVASWAKAAIDALIKAGVVDVTADGILDPEEMATRKDMAILIYKVLK